MDSENRVSSDIVERILCVPAGFHQAGILGERPLRRIADYLRAMEPRRTAETGCGQSTLLFSHLSAEHLAFTAGPDNDDSSARVQTSELFNSRTTSFVYGPTQKTLPGHVFDAPLDVALIDGPHGYPFPDLEYYYLYSHLRTGALLIVDDIQIPTIASMFSILVEDAMFELKEIVGTTGILERTGARTFPVDRDQWWQQGFNNEPRKQSLRQLLRSREGSGYDNPFRDHLFPSAYTSNDRTPSRSTETTAEATESAIPWGATYGRRLRFVLYMGLALLVSPRLAAVVRTQVRRALGRK